jgi:hypothetical protein
MGAIAAYNPTGNSTAGTSGSFAGGSDGTTSAQLAAFQKSTTPAEFFSDPAYGITSAEQQFFLTNGQLNQQAADLASYVAMTQQERQSIQDQMVAIGALSTTAATGISNSTNVSAFKSLEGDAASQGTDVISFLTQNATPTAAIGSQISADLTKATESATAPTIVNQENPTTLSATLTSAFENALGYSPDQAQIQSFISQVQGQDASYAEGPRAAAQAEIAQAHSEDSALNKLGPDGIDSVISAYQAAVTGTKLPGAGTTQGPAQTNLEGTSPVFAANGTASIPVNQQTTATLPPGFPTPPGATNTTSTQMKPEGGLAGFANSLLGHGNQNVVTPQRVVTSKFDSTVMKKEKSGNQQIAPTHLAQPTSTTYGGAYALNQADWTEAQKLYPAAKKFTSPGLAPSSVQLGAFTSLLSNAYDANGGSWSKAISAIASGTPLGTSKGANLTAFGDSVASEVNNQITALQNQVNNDAVTVKTTAPDATAEADLAAKQSDPTGYTAAQDASWGEVLNKMLSGTTSMYDQSTSDTFTGPVAAEASTPTTVGAGAP